MSHKGEVLSDKCKCGHRKNIHHTTDEYIVCQEEDCDCVIEFP